MTESGPAAGRIESIRQALGKKPYITPRICDRIAEGFDDPLLADFLATEVAPRIGHQLAGSLRQAILPDGDLPDAARLRAIASIEGSRASDVLLTCLKDGSPLLRELALELTASKFPEEKRLVEHCRKMLTPLTSMPLQTYFAGKLFSIRQGLPCQAAVKLLGSTDSGDQNIAIRGARHFFGDPPPLVEITIEMDDSPPRLPDLEGPMPDLPVKQLLEHLARPIGLTDLVTTIRMLGESGDPLALEPLLDTLRKERILELEQVPSSYAHDALCEAIVAVGGQTAGRPLGKFVLSANNDNDYAFFSALGAIHTHRLAGALPYLVDRLRRSWTHPGTPSLLVAAICRIGGPAAARATLEAALADDTPKDSRPHLLEAFADLADQLPHEHPAIADRLSQRVPGARVGPYQTALLKALSVLGGKPAGVVLVDQALHGKSPNERTVAWSGLGRVGGPEALKALLSGLAHHTSDLDEALAIVHGLAALGETSATGALAGELDREHRWQVRLAIIDALGHMGPAAKPRLQAEHQLPAYSSSAPTAWTSQVKISVDSALARIG